MKRILIVEDETSIRDVLSLNMELNGYDVVSVKTAEAGYAEFRKDPSSFDVALLDIMLPGMDGVTLCEMLRKENDRIGIIMLSARSQERDKVNALSIGADDYVIKPFSISELKARVDAVYRRCCSTPAQEREKREIRLGDFVLDFDSRRLTKNRKDIDLTQVEFQIMKLFFENPGIALDRDSILKGVWGDNYYGDIKIVDVNIRRLRMKIEAEPSNPKHIVTIWGFGYRWNI